MSRGDGRLYLPRMANGQPCKVWWMDYSVRGIRIRQSSKTRDPNEARHVLEARREVARTIIPARGADLPSLSTGEPIVSEVASRNAIEISGLLTLKEVAAWLNVSPRQVRGFGIPCFDIGHKTKRYAITDVQAWLDAHRGSK